MLLPGLLSPDETEFGGFFFFGKSSVTHTMSARNRPKPVPSEEDYTVAPRPQGPGPKHATGRLRLLRKFGAWAVDQWPNEAGQPGRAWGRVAWYFWRGSVPRKAWGNWVAAATVGRKSWAPLSGVCDGRERTRTAFWVATTIW